MKDDSNSSMHLRFLKMVCMRETPPSPHPRGVFSLHERSLLSLNRRWNVWILVCWLCLSVRLSDRDNMTESLKVFVKNISAVFIVVILTPTEAQWWYACGMWVSRSDRVWFDVFESVCVCRSLSLSTSRTISSALWVTLPFLLVTLPARIDRPHLSERRNQTQDELTTASLALFCIPVWLERYHQSWWN